MPVFERHMFVCTSGEWCPAVDGDGLGVHAALKAAVKARGLGGRIRVNHAGCFSQCGNGPMAVVYPEGVWYAALTPDDADEIVDQPLVVLAEDHESDLHRLLQGLIGHPPLVAWELIVVGNAPSFDLAPALESQDLEIEPWLLATSERLGWADAVNLGLRRARGEIAVLLDTSVEPTGDLVAPLLAAFGDRGVGSAGPFGVTSKDLRRVDEAPPGDVEASEGHWPAGRRRRLGDGGP